MTAVKFTFDDDFEGEAGGAALRRNKLEDIQAAAFAEGREAGRTEIINSLEQSCETLLQNIALATQNLQMRQDEQIALMNREAAKLTHAIIEKLAPALVSQTPLAEIELLINQCLKNSPLSRGSSSGSMTPFCPPSRKKSTRWRKRADIRAKSS